MVTSFYGFAILNQSVFKAIHVALVHVIIKVKICYIRPYYR